MDPCNITRDMLKTIDEYTATLQNHYLAPVSPTEQYSTAQYSCIQSTNLGLKLEGEVFVGRVGHKGHLRHSVLVHRLGQS